MSKTLLLSISIAIFIIAGMVAGLPFYFERTSRQIPYNDCINLIDKREVSRAELYPSRVILHLHSYDKVSCGVVDPKDILTEMVSREIPVTVKKGIPYLNIVIALVSLLFLLFISRLFTPLVSRGEAAAERSSKKKIKPSSPKKKVTFKDVAGIPEVIEELREIVLFLREPEKVSRLGGRIPKGVLLQGPPGTGKTLIGKAIAGEAGVPFFSISGSDFVEMFVGVGASRVRELFKEAKKRAPCIVFIDEIDAIGRHRGSETLPGQDEREQTLNALLVEMDGFESEDTVIVLGATNRPDILDPALLRPGRFDRQITVPPPNVKGRYKILKLYGSKIKMAKHVDLMEIARSTPGFTGADLSNLVNEAALLAARRGKEYVDASDFEDAKDKIMLGIEQKGLTLSEEERRVIAYHEAGHAVVAMSIPECDPVTRISIIPRGMSLGVTQQAISSEKKSYTRSYLEGKIAMLLAGRAAEELFSDTTTTSAYDDIQKATDIATKMVMEFGMSEKLGPVAYAMEQNQFLGGGIRTKQMSPETAKLVDLEIKEILERGYKTARSILNRERFFCGKLADILYIEETMDAEEIEIIKECAQKITAVSDSVTTFHDCATCPSAQWCEQAFKSPSTDDKEEN